MANNWPLRGAKFGVFQGSFRTAAVVHSPNRLPAAVVGRTTDALIYVSDWYTTIAEALAGVDPAIIANETGPVPPDGVNVWPALQGAALSPPTASPRASIVHEYDEVQGIYAYRSGPWKLIWGKIGTSDWIEDISYDSSCSALLPPNGSNSAEFDYGAAVDASVETERLALAGDGSLECTEDKPCLFNVIEDPLEKNETAEQLPNIVAQLRAELKAYVATRYTGDLDVAQTSQDDYCAWIKRVKWVQPYDPLKPAPSPAPSPPLPPSPPVPTPAAQLLTGNWSQGDSHEIIELIIKTSTPESTANGSTAHAQAVNCTGCCWSFCNGAATSEADGGWGVRLVRTCGKDTEVQHGVLSGQRYNNELKIRWTKEDFGASEIHRNEHGGGGGWKDWVKVQL